MNIDWGVLGIAAGLASFALAASFPAWMLFALGSAKQRDRMSRHWRWFAAWGLFSAIHLGLAYFTGHRQPGNADARSSMAAGMAMTGSVPITASGAVAEGLVIAGAAKAGIQTHWAEAGVLPDSNSAAGVAEPQAHHSPLVDSVTVGRDGVITVRFAGDEPEPGTPGARTIVITPLMRNGGIEWDCTGGDMPDDLRPVECRG